LPARRDGGAGSAPQESFEWGLEAYRSGSYFEAHERWEERWRVEPDADERTFLQALVQLAAALYKVDSGIRPRGAEALFSRAADKLERLTEARHGVHPRALAARIRACEAACGRYLRGHGPAPTAPSLDQSSS
jgi:predicted metal-dependent hydrolase